MAQSERKDPYRCGTVRGFHKHRRQGETQCTICTSAHVTFRCNACEQARAMGLS